MAPPTSRGHRGYSRQYGGKGEELGSQVGQVHQQENEERLDDAHPLGEACDEGQQHGKDEAHQGAPDIDDKEGGCSTRSGPAGGAIPGREENHHSNNDIPTSIHHLFRVQ